MGKYLLTLLNVGSRAVFSLLLNKWVAVQFGSQGIVLLGQFQNAVSIASAAPTDGLQRGFIKHQSGLAEADAKWLQILLLSHIISGLFAFPVWWWVFDMLPKAEQNISFVILAELSLIVMLLGSAALCIDQAKLAFTRVNLLQIGATSVSTLAAIGCTFFMPLSTSLAISVFFQGLPILFTIKVLINLFPFPSLQSLPWKPMLGFAGSMLIIALLGRITDMWTRSTYLNAYGVHQTGLWQAVQKISELYFVPLTALLNLIFFAKASGLAKQQTELSKYFFKWLWITATGSIGVLGFMYWWRSELIDLLTATSFSEATELMPLQLAGDFFKSISYIIAMLAIAKGLMLRVIAIELASVTIYVLLVLWQTYQEPFETISQVHLIRYFVYTIVYALQLPTILKATSTSQ